MLWLPFQYSLFSRAEHILDHPEKSSADPNFRFIGISVLEKCSGVYWGGKFLP
jgi:hypothetical protein